MKVLKAKIWNDHTKDYSEKFKDEMVTIPAKQFVVMEKPDADQFMGQYVPIQRDGQGKDLSLKMLRLEVIPADAPQSGQSFACMACNKAMPTEKELQQHIAANHIEQMAEEEAKEEVKKKAR
jgi:hypothetical protein